MSDEHDGEVGQEDWPELLKELSVILGPKVTLRLAKECGGLDSVRIPATPDGNVHLWRRVLTAKQFELVCNEYGGQHLSLPRGVFVQLSKRRVLELHAQGLNNRQIALQVRCGERYVRRILESVGTKSRFVSPKQLSLLDR